MCEQGSSLVEFMFLLVFQSTQNEVVRFIQVIFYPEGKKVGLLLSGTMFSFPVN